MDTKEFDDIRPYNDEELPKAVEELIADPAFVKAVNTVLPHVPFDLIAAKMRSCKTTNEFQRSLCYDALTNQADKTSGGITLDMSALPDPTLAFTYISNHRDITLDSGFLSLALMRIHLQGVEIAIGDNLLIHPWIKKFVRINKSFIVQRALTMRQMLESSERMSRYMHYAITEKKQSIWIAQREGRAKDSNDITQESVLKMIAMGGEGSIIESLKEMNIVPLTISYEYDPCDYLKAQEFQLKRDNPEYKKTTQDDMKSMAMGIEGQKGKIHFQMSASLNDFLASLDPAMPKTDLYATIAKEIDKCIHQNYRIYPGNYVAYDLLKGEDRFASHYSSDEKTEFEEYVAGQLDKIDLPNKDVPYLYEKILTMYANPLINHLIACEPA